MVRQNTSADTFEKREDLIPNRYLQGEQKPQDDDNWPLLVWVKTSLKEKSVVAFTNKGHLKFNLFLSCRNKSYTRFQRRIPHLPNLT